MSFIELLILSIGLAMDCFAVSIACGLIMKRVRFGHMLRIAFLFGFFQAMMPTLGWLLGTQFYDYISRFDHWIAFGILAFLGGKMIWEDLFEEEEEKDINPYQWGPVLILAVATSIDALAVGLSFSLLEVNLWLSVVVIGLVSFIVSWVGMLLSVWLGKRLRLKAELIGGIILLGIGLKVLLQHLLA